MSDVVSYFCSEKKYSYQHLHGEMLFNLNRLAAELKISHSEYRIMATLIAYWNKDKSRAYPTIRDLAKICCMGNSTILKGLDKLKQLNLIFIVKDPEYKRQNYYINQQKFLPALSNTYVTSCKNTHDKKRKEQKYINNKNNLKTQYQMVRGENLYKPDFRNPDKILSKEDRNKILKANAPELFHKIQLNCWNKNKKLE